MIYVIDTNVLLRFVQRTHPLHPTVRIAIRKLRHVGHQLRITSQNCIEFWNVVTRPIDKNGLGLTPTDADRLLRLIERLFSRLPDTPDMYPDWRWLVVTFGVSGVQVHDTRLVAIMKINDVTQILTFNEDDFTRYESEGIVALGPATV